MTIRKRTFTILECLDDVSSGSYQSDQIGPFSDERQYSSSSAVSDACSSATSRYTPPSLIQCSSRKFASHSTVLKGMLLGNTSGWTDEKHRLYLNSIEAEFVRSLHALDRNVPLYFKPHNISTSELSKEDWAESHPIIYHDHQVLYSSEASALASKKTKNVVETCTSSLCDSLEFDCGRRPSSVCANAGSDTMNGSKKRALEVKNEPIEIKLQLSDLSSRFLQPQDTSNFSDIDREVINGNLNSRRKFQKIDDVNTPKKVLVG